MAYISNEIINEVLNRCDIVDVISKDRLLIKRGKNYFCLCPFHGDRKNPSMCISPSKQIFTCFTCGAAGNVFTYISKRNQISYREAVALLAKDHGYDIKIDTSLSEKHIIDYEIYDLAVKFYQNNLNSTLGKNAIEYLENRKIDKETIKKFKIGLSLNKSLLTEFLLNKKYDLDKLIDLGLTTERKIDKFQNRIMFPLFDIKGNVVAFSGRIYNTKDISKYVNTMETDIFKKGSLLYNYHNAKDNFKKTDYIIVMEGFMDVIRASTIGIDHCVATMGTAFTKEHVKLLQRITNNIILCFDGDKAGEDATLSALNVLEDNDVTPRIIRLPEKLDPDEYILKYGADSFKLQIEKTITPIEFKMQILKNNKNLTDLTDISKYIDEAIKELIKVEDSVLVELTLKKISLEYNVEYNTLKNKYNNYLQNKKVEIKQEEIIVKKDKLKQHELAEYHLIYYMLSSNDVLKEVENRVIYFPDDLIRFLYNEIEYFYNKYGIISISSFINYISEKEELLELLNKIISYVTKEEYTIEEINDYIEVVNKYLKKEKVKQLEKELRDEIDPIKKASILNKIMEVKGVRS